MFLIIESASDKHVFQDLIIIVAPGMAHLIENKQMTSFGPTFQNRAVQLFERTATALQARLEGSFSLDFLKSVQPLIVVALSHPKQKISNPAQTMWNLTWAKSQINQYHNYRYQDRHKTLSLKIPNVEFDVGYSMLGFTTLHIHRKYKNEAL